VCVRVQKNILNEENKKTRYLLMKWELGEVGTL